MNIMLGGLGDVRVGGKDGLMDGFAWMVTTRAFAYPLEDGGEVGIGGSDIDNLTNAIHQTRLEGNVPDKGLG